jgi:hypothetical protein
MAPAGGQFKIAFIRVYLSLIKPLDDRDTLQLFSEGRFRYTLYLVLNIQQRRDVPAEWVGCFAAVLRVCLLSLSR